jgi:hypothetical protein
LVSIHATDLTPVEKTFGFGTFVLFFWQEPTVVCVKVRIAEVAWFFSMIQVL